MVFRYLAPKLIYPAPRVQVPLQPPELMESHFISDRYHCWFKPPQNPHQPVLIWIHGNAENLETLRQIGMYSKSNQLDMGFVAMDYPGYGLSQGKPHQEEVVASVNQTVLEAQKRWPQNPLFLAGHSLGSGIAFQVSVQIENLAGLIVVSPFTSLQEAGEVHYPKWLVSFLSTLTDDTYLSLEAAHQIKHPTLIIHGKQDDVVPFDHGQKIAQAMPQATKIWLDNYNHSDLLIADELWHEIGQFIKIKTV